MSRRSSSPSKTNLHSDSEAPTSRQRQLDGEARAAQRRHSDGVDVIQVHGQADPLRRRFRGNSRCGTFAAAAAGVGAGGRRRAPPASPCRSASPSAPRAPSGTPPVPSRARRGPTDRGPAPRPCPPPRPDSRAGIGAVGRGPRAGSSHPPPLPPLFPRTPPVTPPSSSKPYSPLLSSCLALVLDCVKEPSRVQGHNTFIMH